MLTRGRLPLVFDAAALRQDLEQLPSDDWVAHFNTGYYDGDWSGVPLRAVAGRSAGLYSDPTATEPYDDTAVLDRCPGLRQAIAAFACELRSVRLLRLGPGAAIREHRDYGLGYELGEVRIHVPLTTNPDVEFRLDGERVQMAAGEVWYLDLSLPHAVTNRGASERVHLVIDCVVNPWLDAQLAAAVAPAGRITPVATAAVPATPAVAVTECVPPSPDTAPLGVPALERLRRELVVEPGQPPAPRSADAFRVSQAVLDCLGLGLEPVHRYLATSPSPAEFERWLRDQLGGSVDARRVARANAIADGAPGDAARVAELEALTRSEPVLSVADLGFWEQNGYVVVADAAPAPACERLRRAIWEHLGASPEDPDSWYGLDLQQGIMVQLFHAPGIEEIHASPRIHKAFAQLAGTPDLVMSADRCGFNPPVRPGAPYGGTGMHLDLDSYAPPVSPGLQGILYLTDTDESQGALRLVPGFHHRIDAWLAELPNGPYPTSVDFEPLESRAISARAGDLIIWSAALPHGPQPNTAASPRIVHYLTMYPTPHPGGSRS